METTRELFDKVFENMEKNMLNEENGDYVNSEDGLVYCGKCHTAKQQMANVGGVLRKIPKNCDCRSKEMEKERKEMEEFEHSMRINRLKSMCGRNRKNIFGILYCKCLDRKRNLS